MMKMGMRVVTVFLLLLLLLIPAGAASARGLGGGLPDGKVIFGNDFVLKEGETLDGDLIVFGGNVTLESGSSVRGSMAVIGGNVAAASGVAVGGDLVMVGGRMEMEGKVGGDMVMVGGHASLGKASVVEGDITTVGGQLERTAGSQVNGNIVDNPTAPTITIPDRPALENPPAIPRPDVRVNFDPFSGILGVLGRAIAVALIAVVASLFLQPQMERVSTAITSQPVMAGSFGLLTVVLSVLAMVVMALTLILIPVSGLGLAVLVLAWLFGLAAMGHTVGERLAREANQRWTAPLSAGIGTLLLMLVVGIVGLIPCFGWLAAALVGLAGIGGVAMTYFGSRIYPQAVPLRAQVPPGDLPPAELPPAS
jgi:hypothetical protein